MVRFTMWEKTRGRGHREKLDDWFEFIWHCYGLKNAGRANLQSVRSGRAEVPYSDSVPCSHGHMFTYSQPTKQYTVEPQCLWCLKWKRLRHLPRWLVVRDLRCEKKQEVIGEDWFEFIRHCYRLKNADRENIASEFTEPRKHFDKSASRTELLIPQFHCVHKEDR